MSRKTKQDLIWITALSLLVQLFWATRLSHPSYFDAYYYSINGRQLATGQGWTEPIIWQYLDASTTLPAPSHTYWMPLTSIIAAGGHMLAGDGFRAAQIPFILLTTTLPLLAYAIARRLFPERWAARTAAFFTMAGGYYAGQWNQPSTFALFAWVAGGGLFVLGLAMEQQRKRLWFAAGVLAGLSHLTRADGLLLLAVGILLLLIIKEAGLFQKAQLLAVYIGGYLAVMGGWFVHMWRVTGSPLSTVGTQTMFLTTYDDTFAYGRQFTLQSYLDWGMGNILRSKLTAVSLSAQTFIAVTGLFFLGGFILWAWIKLGRKPKTEPLPELVEGKGVTYLFLRPFTLYTITLYASMSLIFTFPGQRGSLFHSSAALWPWAMALAAVGIGFVVEWVATKLPHWRPEKSKPLFAGLFVIIVFVISIVLSSTRPSNNDEAALYAKLGAQMESGERVMLGDPLAFQYHTGIPAVILPNESPAVVLEAMAQYDIDILLLDPDRVQPMADLYDGNIIVPALELVQTVPITTTQGVAGELQWYQRME